LGENDYGGYRAGVCVPAPRLEDQLRTTPAAVLEPLNRLVGRWRTEATHPAFPGVVVHGSVDMEWLEGQRFLIQRARAEHPDLPDSISIIGIIGSDRVDDGGKLAEPADGNAQLGMHYYDSRGVFRYFDLTADDDAWRFWRTAPGFSQRFTGTFTDGGDTIIGLSQLCRDDVTWDDDLAITYRLVRRG
jgi:hypothetical protein